MSNTISREDLHYLSDFVKKRSGINLGEDKAYLIESRLLHVARKFGLNDVGTLVQKLKASPTEVICNDVTEAMTTNETLFFRDIRPFDQLRDVVIPHVIKNNSSKKIRIWSAACSTGQEPYTIAMILEENKTKWPGIEYSIMATDISRQVLEKARAGEYSQFEVQRGLPITLLIKYFTQNGDKWKIKDGLKSNIEYKELNLIQDIAGNDMFDIIFCRNVLIYFEPDIKAKVFEGLTKSINPYGILYLGSAETIYGITDKFKAFGTEKGLYCLNK